MRMSVFLSAVLLIASILVPASAAAEAEPAVERVSARLTAEGFASVGRGGRFSLPQFRIYDSQGREVFEMHGFTPGRFAHQVRQALAQPTPTESERTLEKVLTSMEGSDGRPVADLPDSDFTLVEYWAEWCAPCKILSKQLEEVLAANTMHRLTLLEVEADPEKLDGGPVGRKIDASELDAETRKRLESGELSREEMEALLAEGGTRGPVHVIDVASLDPETVRKLQSGDLSQEEMHALLGEVHEAGAMKQIDPSRLDPELREKLEGGALTPEELEEIIEKAGIGEAKK